MSLTAQLLLFGVGIGSRIAIGTVGFALLSGTSRFFDFAFAASYVVLGYTFAFFLDKMALAPATLLTLVVGGLVGVATTMGLYRPLRRRRASGRLILLAGIGITTVVTNLVGIVFTTTPKSVSTPLLSSSVRIGPYILTGADVAAIVLMVVVVSGLTAFLRWTRWGKAIRAVTENPTMAQIIGINQEQTLCVAYALGTAAVAISAGLDAMSGSITPQTGLLALFNVAIPSIVGGLTNLTAVAAAGLLYGVITNVVIEWLPTEWQIPFTFSVFAAVLLVRPWGFAGNRLSAVEI